jgi:hypothetical protein
VALELTDMLQERIPSPAADAATLGRDLADCLAAAHWLGLAHGRLEPAVLRGRTLDKMKLDFTGIDPIFPNRACPPPGRSQ